ncbi:MAG TPA: GMC family oxidoreductase [Solirubrobacteraceae bacterium]|nr:GMC family oxidoreductase [Solirubrobacteraceae bacterium]
MRVNGPNVFDEVLAPVVTLGGVLAIAWAITAALLPGTLLPAGTTAGGVLAGVGGAAGVALVLGGGGVRRYAGVLSMGALVLGLVGAALVVSGALDGRLGAILSGAVMLTAALGFDRLRSLARRAGYRPVWLSARGFETVTAATAMILDADGREAIPPERAAANTDRLLAAIDAPVKGQIRLLFWALEWIMPAIVIGRPLPFSTLGGESRRRLIETLIRPTGPLTSLVTRPFGTVARTLKALICGGYYGDPVTMRSIGFAEYEGSSASHGQNLSLRHYPDPFPNANATGPTARRTVRGGVTHVDAIVVGAGASGSVMAYQLARRKGLSVVVLERGRREDPQTFQHSELDMFPRVYKDGGLQTTSDRNSAIFQGATVGGSTVINNAIWLVPPQLNDVLREWHQRGATVPKSALVTAYAELEHALQVGLIDKSVANPGTDLFLKGAGKTGKLLDNNRVDCLGCGWCNYGCRYNRKTSMLVTYVPWAEGRGVVFEDRVSDARIIRDESRRRAIGVDGWRTGDDGERRRISYRAEKVVVCAGAIGSTELLLQSGITAGGHVGKGFHALGGLFVTGDMGQVVDGYAGIGLTAMDTGQHQYVLESYFAPPLAFSVRVGGWLLSHFDRVQRYRHFIDGGVMVGTDPSGGNVTLKGGTASVSLTPTAQDMALLKQGLTRMTEIYFTAGARRVYPSTFKYIDLLPGTYKDVIDREINTIDDILFGSAHPQGGNAMNRDSNAGVVGENFMVHGVEGLYVADTSVWPSNIRANCQATAMAMSHYASTQVAP